MGWGKGQVEAQRMATITWHRLEFEMEGREEVWVVACAGEEIIATAHAAVGGDVWTLFKVFVAEGWRRKGWGRVVVRKMEEEAREKGAEVVSVVAGREVEGWWRGRGYGVVHREGGRAILSKRLEGWAGGEATAVGTEYEAVTG